MASKVADALRDLLGIGQAPEVELHGGRSGTHALAMAGHSFIIEFSQSSSAAPVAAAARKVRERAMAVGNGSVPLVVVPFMGEVGRRLCEEVGVCWLDLSGNGRIVAPGLRVVVGGRPNRFLSAGRPANLFAPKSSRVTRWLLTHHPQAFTQRELSQATGLDEGFVSRLSRRLDKDGYLVREGDGRIWAKEPQLLLDAWRESYQFSKHTLYQGHVAARSGDSLLRFVSETLSELGVSHAATGLAGAWVLTRYSGFRIATFYVPADPTPALVQRLGFREEPRGSNLWLVVPNDEGVFQGAVERDGIQCAHPVQVYVDLKGHPERASEAADQLRTELLMWRQDG